MEEPDTPADPLAAMDQLLRAVVDVAKMMHAYFTALVGEGFTPQQALTLTVGYQTAVLSAAARGES